MTIQIAIRILPRQGIPRRAADMGAEAVRVFRSRLQRYWEGNQSAIEGSHSSGYFEHGFERQSWESRRHARDSDAIEGETRFPGFRQLDAIPKRFLYVYVKVDIDKAVYSSFSSFLSLFRIFPLFYITLLSMS